MFYQSDGFKITKLIKAISTILSAPLTDLNAMTNISINSNLEIIVSV